MNKVNIIFANKIMRSFKKDVIFFISDLYLSCTFNDVIVAPANLMTTFGTVCSLSPPVKDEDSPQRHYAQ